MKILYINTVCGVGSTGRIVADLAQKAKVEGHSVKVVCSSIEPIKGISKDEVIAVGTKFDYYIHNIMSKLTDREGCYSKHITNMVISEIEKFDPDIVHLHNLHGHWLNYELLFQYLARENKKVIWTLHDCWAFTGHCTYFSMLGCEEWKKRCEKCGGLHVYPRCYGFGDTKQNFERKKRAFTSVKDLTIITPSEWLKNIVADSFLNIYPTYVIHNKIDLDVFKPTPSDFRIRCNIGGRIIILGVANVWTKAKGLNDFIALANRLDENYVCVLVGLTQKQVSSLPENIIAIERTHSSKELAEIYTAADVFINASYQDNYPTVNLEAIACGTPVIAYKTGGICEAFDELSGISIRQGDVEAILNSIIDALELDRRNILKRAKEFSNYGNYTPFYSGLILKKDLNAT